jgi:hypothetical protein
MSFEAVEFLFRADDGDEYWYTYDDDIEAASGWKRSCDSYKSGDQEDKIVMVSFNCGGDDVYDVSIEGDFTEYSWDDVMELYRKEAEE